MEQNKTRSKARNKARKSASTCFVTIDYRHFDAQSQNGGGMGAGKLSMTPASALMSGKKAKTSRSQLFSFSLAVLARLDRFSYPQTLSKAFPATPAQVF
jgi:hypothetical protein